VGIILSTFITLSIDYEKEEELRLMNCNIRETSKFQFIKRKKFSKVKVVQRWNER
jgi:hypothetical protein